MKSFEDVIKRRILFQVIKAVIIAALVITVFIVRPRLQGNIELWDHAYRGLLAGLFCGGVIMPIMAILKYRKALKTPNALEELHIEEADERNRMLALKTCRSTLNLTFSLLGIVGLVASFFSLTVLLTIGATIIVIALMYGLLKVYYSRRY